MSRGGKQQPFGLLLVTFLTKVLDFQLQCCGKARKRTFIAFLSSKTLKEHLNFPEPRYMA